MSEENKKQIKVKMRVVAFSDLPELKEISYKQIGVGNMKVKDVKSKDIAKDTTSNEDIQKQLELEGNESLF